MDKSSNKCNRCFKILGFKSFCNCNIPSLEEVEQVLKVKNCFSSKKEAEKYLKKDWRTLEKHFKHKILIQKPKLSPEQPFTGDMLVNPQFEHLKKIICKACNLTYQKTHCRSGFCVNCRKMGLGRKSQARKLKEIYNGSNNPNYKHGKSGSSDFRNNKNKLIKKLKKELNIIKCEFSGKVSNNIDGHHILPCSLFPEFSCCEWNILFIDRSVHIELHRHNLDLVLLPNLFELRPDVHQLKEVYCHLLLTQSKIEPYELGPSSKDELVKVVCQYGTISRPEDQKYLKYVPFLSEYLLKCLEKHNNGIQEDSPLQRKEL